MIIKKLSLLLTLLVFFNIGYSQNWEQVTSGNSNSLNASFFISHKKGWVVGNQGTILKTEDSGMSWSVQESGSTAKLYDIYFVDYNNGYAVGGCATVLKTMNGGDSWELVRENCSGGEFFSIVMKDNNTGIAVGTSNIGTFYTNDGFDTDIGGSDLGVYANKLQKVQFTNRIFTCTNSSIKVSDDYGLSWQNIKNHNAILGNLKFGHYLHPNAIYVANSSKVFRSSDTQENWSVILDPADGFSQMQSIFFLNELKGYVVSTYGAETTIRVTRDGGKTFSTELTDYFSAIRDINFYNDSTGLAVGDNGSILKYDMTDTIYNAIYEDTVIYNTSYKDTVVYNVTYSDSVIYDTTRVEVYDTLYFATVTGITYEPLATDIKIYPNPTDGLINFGVTDGYEIKKISVYDVEGRLVRIYAIKNETSINLEIDEGVYFLLIDSELNGNNGYYIKKIIKK